MREAFEQEAVKNKLPTHGFDPRFRPEGRLTKKCNVCFLCPAVICGLAVVSMGGCGHEYIDWAVLQLSLIHI